MINEDQSGNAYECLFLLFLRVLRASGFGQKMTALLKNLCPYAYERDRPPPFKTPFRLVEKPICKSNVASSYSK